MSPVTCNNTIVCYSDDKAHAEREDRRRVRSGRGED